MLFRCPGAYLINVVLERCGVDVLAEIRVDFESPGQPLVAKRVFSKQAGREQEALQRAYEGDTSADGNLTSVSTVASCWWDMRPTTWLFC